jgi:hypothetical protein
LCALYNFIRQQRIKDNIFDLAVEEVKPEVDSLGEEQTDALVAEVEIGTAAMNAFRYSIAKEMF